MPEYIDVIVLFSSTGEVRPLFIAKDAHRFSIDKVLDICPAASLKAGGRGMRYTCRIHGRIVKLFWDKNGWFYESSDQP